MSAAGTSRRPRTGGGCPIHRKRGAAPLARVCRVRARCCWPSTWPRCCCSHAAASQRVKVPFSPYFVSEVQAGQVASIASKGDTIQGTFKAAVRYPEQRREGHADDAVRDTGPSVLEQRSADGAAAGPRRPDQRAVDRHRPRLCSCRCCLGFGPTLLIVGIIILFMRRAAKSGGGMGALGNFGRSKARRVDPATIRVTFADVAGIDEAKSELTEIVDFLRNPDALRTSRRTDAPRGAALRRARDGQDAARSRGRGRGARGVLLDLGLGVHRGDRRRRRLARARPVHQGQGGGTVDHLHRRARRDRPLAAGIGRRSPAPTTSASRRSIRS